MDYIIGNGTQYLNCDSNGRYQLCGKGMAKIFTEKAANGFIKHTPKQFRKYHMKMFPVCEKSEYEIKQDQILMKAEKHAKKAGYIVNGNEKKVKQSKKYDPDVWIKKLKNCNGIKTEAQERLAYLYKKLSIIDQAQNVMLHIIENNNHPSAFQGYDERMDILKIRDKRRDVKNELEVVLAIVHSDVSSKLCNQVENMTEGLINPKNIDKKYSKEVLDELIKEFDK